MANIEYSNFKSVKTPYQNSLTRTQRELKDTSQTVKLHIDKKLFDFLGENNSLTAAKLARKLFRY